MILLYLYGLYYCFLCAEHFVNALHNTVEDEQDKREEASEILAVQNEMTNATFDEQMSVVASIWSRLFTFQNFVLSVLWMVVGCFTHDRNYFFALILVTFVILPMARMTSPIRYAKYVYLFMKALQMFIVLDMIFNSLIK